MPNNGAYGERDPADFWHEQFLYALSGLRWAVGRLGDDAGYAGIVHKQLTHPVIHFPSPDTMEHADSVTEAPKQG